MYLVMLLIKVLLEFLLLLSELSGTIHDLLHSGYEKFLLYAFWILVGKNPL